MRSVATPAAPPCARPRGRLTRGATALACALVLQAATGMIVAAPAGAQTGAATTGPVGGGGSPDATAALVQCVTTGEQNERSATFAGEMTMIPGATKMAMRLELLERTPGETGYRPVLAPGVGVWRSADPGVKIYKHLEQVTDLAAPAYYRALVSFRWTGPHGRVLKREERRTPRCVQPAPAPPAPASPLE